MATLEDRVWDYEAYCQLPDDGNRYEVIDGRLYVTPAPLTLHQLVSRRLQFFLYQLERQGLGFVYNAPVDLLMPGCSPVQPDLIFLSRAQRRLIKAKFIEGVPTLVVEILSPGSIRQDRVVKLRKYAQNQVPFYWLLDPEQATLEILEIDGAGYRVAAALSVGDHYTFMGHTLDLAEVFAPLPEDEEA